MKKKIKVLVVDDNPGFIRLNQNFLNTDEYEMISAANGVEGLKKAREELPDVILLDIIMPEMHGYEVCQELKGDEKTKKIPVVIVTGTGLEEIAVNEPSIGADGFIPKPYNFDQLDTIIKKVIKER